jgi:hypothetical protein
MNAEVELISTMGEKKAVTRPPIQMEFQVGNKYSIYNFSKNIILL